MLTRRSIWNCADGKSHYNETAIGLTDATLPESEFAGTTTGLAEPEVAVAEFFLGDEGQSEQPDSRMATARGKIKIRMKHYLAHCDFLHREIFVPPPCCYFLCRGVSTSRFDSLYLDWIFSRRFPVGPIGFPLSAGKLSLRFRPKVRDRRKLRRAPLLSLQADRTSSDWWFSG